MKILLKLFHYFRSNENNFVSSVRRIIPLIILMFLVLVLFSVLDEILDLPHVFFNSIETPVNWNEIIIEASFIIIVSIIVVYFLKKLINKQIKFETELNTKNQEYYTLYEEYLAQNEELYTKNEELIQEIEKRKLIEQQIKNINEELEQKVKERTALLEAANKELESFSYSVSHDLRAPLRAITGYANILHEDYFNKLDDERRNVLNAIQDNSKNMAQLIDDILEFSRLGRKDITIQELNMDLLFKTSYNELYQQEKNRKIELKTNNLPLAYGDITLIKIIINNLLSNAIKYTRTRDVAQINVSGYREKGKCIYKIEDNGIGFDEKYKDKLFGVFQRLHSKREFEGTGVGLAIVQRIINKHGGEVWSKGKINKGATFFFSIPVQT